MAKSENWRIMFGGEHACTYSARTGLRTGDFTEDTSGISGLESRRRVRTSIEVDIWSHIESGISVG